MTVSVINIGNAVNDGLGDDLRSAFQKVNSNFAFLNTAATAITDVNDIKPANSTGFSLFTGFANSTLGFKRIITSPRLTFTEASNFITLDTVGMFTTLDDNIHSVTAYGSTTLKLLGDSEISVRLVPPTTVSDPTILKISSNYPVGETVKTFDFGSIGASITNVMELYLSTTDVDFGTITEPNTLALDINA